ncbi:MAG: YfhO family protein [Eubacteriales bacterium]|nr:YfhO family protein [Eubacteriales bacterium]
MKRDKVWQFLKSNYVYTLTFFFALLMMVGAWMIGDIGPFGGKSLVVVDGVHQYLPFFAEYQDKLKHLDSLQYTMDVGLGNNFLSLWSYYLSSPFNLIILLCGKTQLPMALNIIISSKIILGALAFAYFLRHAAKEPAKNLGIVVFSLFYAFSSYVIGYYWNLMWLDCVFIFPIIILGMQKMLIDKDSRCYILALLYSLVCNYYISFMICFFLVLWFFTFRFENIKDFFMKGIRFAIASLTAAAMSAVVLLPAYKGIMTTASATFGFPKWKFYGSFADTLRSHLFCSDVTTNQVTDAGTNLYCGIFTILLACMFFFIREIKLDKKIKYGIILVFLVVSFNNQLLNYIWHGFHNQYGIPNRFAFLYIFVLLIMAYEVFLKRDYLKKSMGIVAYIISMLFVVFSYYNADEIYDTKVYVMTGVFLTIYLILFTMYKDIPKKKWKIRYAVQYGVVALAIIEMAVNGCLAFYQVGSSEPDYYYGDTKLFEGLRDSVADADDSLYRSDILRPIFVDEATWYNLRSIGIFGSTVRGELVDMMGDLGFYTGANEYLYYGATPFTNALFGVKYVYVREGDYNNLDMGYYDNAENISVYKNDRVLPIAYMVSDDVYSLDTEGAGPFTVQNELSGALTGVEPIFTTIYDDLEMEVMGTNLNVEQTDENNVSYEKANDDARADIIYKMPRDMDLYINCSGSNVYKIALLIDGNEVAFDRYHGQIFHVGKMKAGQMVDIQFVLNEGDDLSGNLYCYPMEFREDLFLQSYSILLNQSMEVTKFKDGYIEGNISAAKDGVFMTSLPYDDGWTIYANGKKMSTHPVVEGLLATYLEKGDYEIKMKYRCPGLKEGAMLSLAGCIVFAVICILQRKKKGEGTNEE